MKKLILILFLLTTGMIFAQFPHPDYTRVHRMFFSQYAENIGGKTVYTSFEKAKEGWYIQYSYPETYMDKKHVLFWDKRTNHWEVLNFDAAVDTYKRISEYRVPYMYRVSPMYGYNGWYRDVIDSLGNKKDLSDTLLYALNKAYFNQFASAFGNQYGDFIPTDVLSSGTYPNTFDVNDLIEVKRRFTMVVETNKRMQQQNPSFETFIGSLSLQYGNDIMDMYMRMYLYQNKEEAAKYMQTNLYDPYILDFAKYLLISCPPSAILFTNGDSDTYPLWYVQYVLNIRTDVAVVNMSLLNHPAYASMIRKTGLVNFTTPEKSIAQDGFEVAMLTTGGKKLYQKDLTAFVNQDFSDKKPKTMEGNSFVLNLNGKEWEAKGGYYIYRGDILILDIMYTNAGKRPFCFTAGNGMFTGLMDPDVQFYQVKTLATPAKDQTEFFLKIWDQDFSLSDHSGFKDYFCSSHNRIVNSMVYDIAARAKRIAKDGRLKEANKIALKLYSIYSSPWVKKDRSWLEAAAIIGKAGNPQLAGKIMDEIIATEKEELLRDKDSNKDESLIHGLETIKPTVMNGGYLD